MPRLNHPDLGDVLSYVYLPGTILAVYPESTDTPSDKWDTVDLTVDGYETVYKNCPVFYHCESNVSVRDNGATEKGAYGFSVGDRCICRCLVKTEKSSITDTTAFKVVFCVGHIEGIKRCSFKYAFVRISASILKELKAPFGEWVYDDEQKKYVYKPYDKDSHKDEMCIVYDSNTKKFASIVDPTKDGVEKYKFPCSVETIKPFLDTVDLDLDDELYKWEYQGTLQSNASFACGYPNAAADINGDKLGVNATGSPYDTYYQSNEVQRLFGDLRLSMASIPAQKMLAGDYSVLDEKIKTNLPSIEEYAKRSPAFIVDKRSFPVEGVRVEDDDPNNDYPPAVVEEIAALVLKKSDYTSSLLIAQAKFKLCQEECDALSSSISEERSRIQAIYDYISSLSLNDAKEINSQLSIVNGLLSDMQSAESYLASKKAELDTYTEEIANLKNRIVMIDSDIEKLSNQKNIFSYAISPKGKYLSNASFHAQACYGENEYWICAKNTYMGIVISYCDAYYKFMRFQSPPVSIPIPECSVSYLGVPVTLDAISIALNVTENNIFDYSFLKRINEGCFHHTTIPAVLSENDFNGAGSYRLTQIVNPELHDDSVFRTAVNSRLEYIDAWDRYDNWMNTIYFCSHTNTANPTWHFNSIGQQWRLSAIYLDTPLGSMFYGSPRFQAALWYMYQLNIQYSTARNDIPFNCQFLSRTRQSGAAAMQIYIVQRQAVSAWNKGVDNRSDFVRQVCLYGPFDCFNLQVNYEIGSEPPAPNIKEQVPDGGNFVAGGGTFGGGGASGSWGVSDENNAPANDTGMVGGINNYTLSFVDEVKYVRDSKNKLVDFNGLSDDEKANLLDDRKFLIRGVASNAGSIVVSDAASFLASSNQSLPSTPGVDQSSLDSSAQVSYPMSRNEVEIFASFDLFSSLKKSNKTFDASKAVRCREFEICIMNLFYSFYDSLPDSNKKKKMKFLSFDAKII